MVQDQRLAAPIPWMKTLISRLPLWLLSLAVSVEGFPTPVIPLWAANVAFACAGIFSIGLIGYRQIKPGEVRNLFLVFGAVLGVTAALYAASNFWGLIDASQFASCYMFGCYPLSIPGHPWWRIFLGL